MAILCLSDDLENLKKRLGSIFIGYTFEKEPVFARDLKVEGAMAALLKEAIKCADPQRWARLRFAIIGPLLAAPPKPGELQAALEMSSLRISADCCSAACSPQK